MSDTHVALCSGGRESTVATHAAVRFGPAELVVHLDTATAPLWVDRAQRENRDYLRELCDEFGWELSILRTPESYPELIRDDGFPGPAYHLKMYNRLKDRQLCSLASRTTGDLHCWTGLRAGESDRRLRLAEPEGERGDGRWYWRSPLVDWPDDRVDEYIRTFDLPENPLWTGPLGSRSVDCWCGAFATREELLDLKAAGYDAHAEWILGFEEEMVGAEKYPRNHESSRERERWAGGSMDKTDFAAAEEAQVTLCSSCGIPEPDWNAEAADE